MNKNQIDMLVLICGRVASMLVAFVILRLLTAILLPVEIGRMAILMTIMGFFGLFLVSPVGNYINRQIIGWENRGMLMINLAYYICYVFLVAIFALLVLYILRLFMPLAPDVTNLWFGVIIFLGISISSLYASFIGYVNLFKKRLAFVVLSNLAGWTGIGLSALLTLVVARTAELWMLGGFITQFIFASIAFYVLFRLAGKKDGFKRINLKTNTINIQGVLKFSLPLSVAVFFYWIQTSGYRFVLQHRFGLETVGIFFINFNIGMQLSLAFETLFNQFYHPIYYNKISSNEVAIRIAAWNDYADAFLPALLILLLFVACSETYLAKILVTSTYWQYSYLIFFGALSEGLRILSTVYSLAAHAEYQTKALIWPGVVAAGMVIILLCLIPVWHLYAGLAISLIIAAACGFFVLRQEIKKVVPVSFPFQKTIKALLFCLPMVAFCLLFSMINQQSFYWLLSFLIIMGSYFLLGQYLFATKWLRGGM